MKILFATPGHLKTVPMGKFCAKALSALGHELLVFDYRATVMDKLRDKLTGFSRPHTEEKSATNARLRKAIDRFKPDLFLALFGFDISIESLEYLRKQGIPSACWWINDPFQLPRSLKKSSHYDYLFSNSAGCLDQYKEAGTKFDGETEIRCYRNEAELVEAIRQAIADDETRRRVAHAAQLRAHRDHTYQNRMASLLKLVAENPCTEKPA